MPFDPEHPGDEAGDREGDRSPLEEPQHAVTLTSSGHRVRRHRRSTVTRPSPERRDRAGACGSDLHRRTDFVEGVLPTLPCARDPTRLDHASPRRSEVRFDSTSQQMTTAHFGLLAIARQVGIVDGDDSRVVTGREITDGEIPDLTSPRVYARTTPEQKLDIIEAWRANGAVVAMTGDGVNDGPALRRADIGVAMGQRGTEVARQAADLVLADDELGTVVAAVEEGRRVYANIRRF